MARRASSARRARAKTRPESAGLRQVPTQPRARETVEHILSTAVELLAEVGMDRFNTNLLAKRAGITVPTVYRYFPNKIAVLEELARRLANAWDTWFDDELLANPDHDWRDVWCGYVDTFVAGVIAAPGGLAVRAALHSSPALRPIEEQNTERLMGRLTRALRRRQPSLGYPAARGAADVLLTSAIAVLDEALTGPPRSRAARLEALKEMHTAYLATLLD